MKISTDLLLLLRKYAKGELSAEERRSVEAMLQQQPELQAELDATRQLMLATERLERQRLLDLIRRVDAQVERPGLLAALLARMSGFWKRIGGLFSLPAYRPKLAWAMAALALLLTAGLWWFLQSSDGLRELQQTAYIPPAAPDALRRGAESGALSGAFREFESGNYRQSLSLLDNITEGDSLYLISLFLKGHNYFRLGRYEQAERTFEKLLGSGRAAAYFLPNADNAAWTRILTLLAQYNLSKDKTKKLELEAALHQFLNTAENPSDAYYQKALELQEALGH